MIKQLSTSILALGCLLATANMASAQASGATDLDISFPDIVVLHYFSNVDVQLTSNALGTWLTGSAGDSSYDEGTASPAAGGFTQDLAIGPSALLNDPAAAVLRLENAWAVRAISFGAFGTTQVSIANTQPTLNHSLTASSMTISSAAVDDGSSSGASITFAAPGLSNGNAVVGDVVLTMDMSAALDAGDYLDGVFTITAQNI